MAFPARSVLSLLGTAGALLTCFAVVLNVDNFVIGAKRESSQAKQVVPPISIGRSETAAETRPEHYELIFDAPPIATSSVDLPSRPLPVGISEPAAQPPITIVGIWVPNAGACSIRNFRDGFLPTIINMDGAWAGETFCIFNNQKQTETGWRVAANCSNAREQWTTQVRLTVTGDRLKWTSKRGTQDYTRCAPDVLLAKAH